MKTKRRYVIRQKICKTATFQLIICYVLGILCIFLPALFPLLVVCLADYCTTVLPSYFIKEKEDSQ
ncbi:MAG: hypothetical protein QXG39_08220 [Candidatus Aenigmatarchaeota archaeon]